jgi:type I restriction enzyme S subunit
VFIINPRTRAHDSEIAGFVPMTYICDGYHNEYRYEKRNWGEIKSGYTHFQNGDIAVAKISPCLENLKSVILDNLPNGIGAGTTELHIFRQPLINAKFALCFFKSQGFIDSCTGTFNGVVGQQRVNPKILMDLNFALPPIAEQERIVAAVEKWFNVIDAIERDNVNLIDYIAKAKSKILDLAISGKLVPQIPSDEPAIEALRRVNPNFKPCDSPQYENMPFKIPESWSWCLFSDIAQSNIGLTYKPTDIVSTGGTPVYRSNNIQNKCIDTSDIVRVNTEIRENQFLNVGDLLICARNGSRNLVGKCALINELDEPTSFGAFMAVSRSLYNTWIFQVLNSDYFDRYLDESNSTAINQVTQKMLLALQIPFPPIAEQQRIVDKVNELFTILDSIQNSLDTK